MLTGAPFWYPGYGWQAPLDPRPVPPKPPPRRCTCGSVAVFGPGGAGHSDWCDLAAGVGVGR